MSYDDIWTVSYDAVCELWWCMSVWWYMSYEDVWVMILDDEYNIYVYFDDVLDMFDTLYGNMMSMMIVWRLP